MPPLRDALIKAASKQEFTAEAGTHISNVPTVWAALFVFTDADHAHGYSGDAGNNCDGLAGAILLRDLDGFYEPLRLYDTGGKLTAAWLEITRQLAKPEVKT